MAKGTKVWLILSATNLPKFFSPKLKHRCFPDHYCKDLIVVAIVLDFLWIFRGRKIGPFRRAMIPRPEMILKLDRKWSSPMWTANDPAGMELLLLFIFFHIFIYFFIYLFIFQHPTITKISVTKRCWQHLLITFKYTPNANMADHSVGARDNSRVPWKRG